MGQANSNQNTAFAKSAGCVIVGAGPLERADQTYVRLPMDALVRMRLLEAADTRALTALHVEEKSHLMEEISKLRELVIEKLGQPVLDAALPDKGELTDKYGECDTAVYSCLLLSAQQEPLTHALLRQEAQVERVRQEAADRVASAEIRVQVADRRVEEAEESKTAALASVAEPLHILAELKTAHERIQDLVSAVDRERARAGRAEAECAAERSGRAQVERLLDGDPDGLQALPLDVLEQWQGRLRLALEAATDALVEMRVAVARRAEAEAAEAAIREKEAAGVPLATDCPICMERHMDTAMDCGHRACGACAEQLRVCHTCRKPVTLRLRLF